MKFEVRCQACGQSYLVDEEQLGPSAGQAPCPGCGNAMSLPAPRSPKRGPVPVAPRRPAAPPRPVRLSAGPGGGRGEPAAAAATAPASPPSTATESDEAICPRCGLHFQPRKRQAKAAHKGRRTVLVVEDMDYFLEIAKDALSPKFEVRTARTFREAWQLLSAGGIDLLVLDLTLGGSDDGRILLEELRTKPCPILVFTSRDESEMYGEEWNQLQALGADDMVLKGMNAGEALLRKSCELLGIPWDDDLG